MTPDEHLVLRLAHAETEHMSGTRGVPGRSQEERLFDLRSVGISGAIGGATVVLLGWVLSGASSDDLGPTAASLTDAFNGLFATAVGLFLAGIVGAVLSRGVSPLTTGIASTAAVIVAILVPLTILTEHPDVTIWGRVLFYVVSLPIGVIGAAAGSLLRVLSVDLPRLRNRGQTNSR